MLTSPELVPAPNSRWTGGEVHPTVETLELPGRVAGGSPDAGTAGVGSPSGAGLDLTALRSVLSTLSRDAGKAGGESGVFVAEPHASSRTTNWSSALQTSTRKRERLPSGHPPGEAPFQPSARRCRAMSDSDVLTLHGGRSEPVSHSTPTSPATPSPTRRSALASPAAPSPPSAASARSRSMSFSCFSVPRSPSPPLPPVCSDAGFVGLVVDAVLALLFPPAHRAAVGSLAMPAMAVGAGSLLEEQPPPSATESALATCVDLLREQLPLLLAREHSAALAAAAVASVASVAAPDTDTPVFGTVPSSPAPLDSHSSPMTLLNVESSSVSTSSPSPSPDGSSGSPCPDAVPSPAFPHLSSQSAPGGPAQFSPQAAAAAPMSVTLRWMWDAAGVALALPFWRCVTDKLVLQWIHSIGLSEEELKARGMVVSAMMCRVPHCRTTVAKALAEASTGFCDRYQLVRPLLYIILCCCCSLGPAGVCLRWYTAALAPNV